MFKLLLRHIALENAIDVLFQKIFKNFPANSKRYSKVFIKNTEDEGDTMFMVLYNVEMSPHEISDIKQIRFEYFKYSHDEYEWMNEINLSNPLKPPKPDVWYAVRVQYIAKAV